MKYLLTSVFISITGFCFSQGDPRSPDFYNTVQYLNNHRIPIKKLVAHNGFSVYYNCDSVPFLKKMSGDSILIWTASDAWAMKASRAPSIASQRKFGLTKYLEVLGDGRIQVTNMHQTVFIHRNDSLFEYDADDKPYQFKLIFAPSMFSDSIKTVKLNPTVNYIEDEIVLENEWVEDGRKCYTIRINNKKGKWETSYSYTFSEDMNFLYWENCKVRSNGS